MDNFYNITPNILKRKIIQKAKTLLIKLSLFKSEENNTSLKTDLLNFLQQKQMTEEENHVKETILIIFREELIKLGILSEELIQRNTSPSKEKKIEHSPEKNESIEKNKQETLNFNISKYRKFKKKITQNERLDEIVKKIENDGGIKTHLINKIKQLNTNIFSYFQFGSDKLNELNILSKEKLLTMICLFYPFFSKEQKSQIDNLITHIFKGSKNISKLNSCLLINNKTNIIPNILNLLIKEIIADKDKLSLQQEIENDLVNVNLENQELIGHQIYIKN